MSEYPDHLNPFKEKKKLGRSLTKSFREIKGFIRQSIKRKKSSNKKNEEFEDVEIRKPQDSALYNTPRNYVMSLPSPPCHSPTIASPALPRSRFKERLSKTSSSNTFNCYYDERCNPFAEEGLNPFDEPPIPFKRTRSKKRATLPSSCSDGNLHIGPKRRDSSKWSLTSSETDCTFDDKSENSADLAYSQALRDCLDNFNREMGTLNKESSEIGGSFPDILDNGENSKEETEYIDSTSVDEINNNGASVRDIVRKASEECFDIETKESAKTEDKYQVIDSTEMIVETNANDEVGQDNKIQERNDQTVVSENNN